MEMVAGGVRDHDHDHDHHHGPTCSPNVTHAKRPSKIRHPGYVLIPTESLRFIETNGDLEFIPSDPHPR
ncbi:hypothetical protein K493DRAFT_314952 [Basidiobolus meristosporus CBS 931.73]|uniref:Uncharacterized protein n=1 Tax=Basidiobolus meristosporus CBS 931.73 TaxID=1314790 RepID=A0A1Y1YBX7_9FUNG|nr:hypothetical protein K493DRAFT_314952 [Basidiobolus meristosporus CBS 931.73]|eukprot:ORX95519.1 hypothetical protein K493DRAFT_314952 [Basidiobolus meristosporus CBS 931.73]